MPITIKNNPEDAGGVNNCIVITIPARGETGWADLVRAAFKKISQHDHTGNENGAQLGVASLEDGAVTKAKINANVAGEGLTKDVTSGALNVKIDDVTIERDAPTNTLRLKDDGVSAAKLNADVAGLGLIQNGVDESLEVNVDDSTIEIDTDIVRVKDLGIVTAKLADAAITTAKLFNGSVTTDKIADDAVTAAKIPFISDTVATDAVQNDTLVWNSNTNQFEPGPGGGGSGGSGINHIPVASSDAEAFSVNSNDWTISDPTGYGVGLASFGTDPNIYPLRGDKSFTFRAYTGAQVGQTIDIPFTVDVADKAKKHLISFDYKPYAPLGVNNFVDDAVRISIIKTVGGVDQEIRVNGEDIKAVTQASTHYAQFQTDPSASANYKLRFTLKDVSATNAGSLILDNIKVSPVGVNDSVSSQAVYVVGRGSGGTYTITADTERIPFTILEDSTGSMSTTDNGPDTFTVPETGSYTIEGNVACGATTVTNQTINAFVNGSISRSLQTSDNGTDRYKHFSGILRLNKGDVLDFRFSAGADVIVENAGTHHWIHIEKIPSLSLPESVGSGRDIVCNLQGLSSSKVINNAQDTLIDNWSTPAIDTAGGWDAVNQYYVIPETGYYDIDFSVLITNDANSDLSRVVVMIKQGSNFLKFSGNRGPGVDYNYADVSKTAAYLEKGQTISFLVRQDQVTTQGAEQNDVAASAIYTNASIAKRQSAQTVLETETVAAKIELSSNQSVSTKQNVVIAFDDPEFDTHNAFDVNTNSYVVPVTGYYSITAQIILLDCEGVFNTRIAIDASSKTYSRFESSQNSDQSTINTAEALVNDIFYLEKGQTVLVYVDPRGAVEDSSYVVAGFSSGGAAYSHLSIARIK